MMRFKRTRGQVTVILVAASILFIFAFCALVVDIGRQLMFRSKLRNYCDSSATAGANLLPNSGNCGAVLAAARMYARNLQVSAPASCPIPQLLSEGPTYTFNIGADTVKITTPFTDPNEPDPSTATTRIRVTSNRTIRNHFGQLLGMPQAVQAANAIARKGGNGDGATIFNKSQSAGLQITSTNLDVTGKIHSNSSMTLTGDNNTSSSTSTFVTTATITGSNNSVPTQMAPVQPSPVLPKTLPIYKSGAVSANTYFTESVQLSSDGSGGIRVTGSTVNQVVPNGSVIYVEGGSITVNENSFMRSLTMISTGGPAAVNVTGNQLNIMTPDGRVLIHSDGPVTVNGNGYHMTGIVDAGGTITINGNQTDASNQVMVNGGLWGRTVIVNGPNIAIHTDPNVVNGTSGSGSALLR